MADLDMLLDDLAPELVVRAFVGALAASHGVASDRQADYVSLRPSTGGPIAVYVHRALVSVATPPGLAPAKAAGLPGSTLDEHTPATTYIRRPATALKATGQAVLTLAADAPAWLATMPDTAHPGSSGAVAALAQPKCATCGLRHAGDCD